VLKNCVVHSDVVIGEGCVLTNEAGVREHNGVDIQSGLGYMIQDGIIVFMPGTKVDPGTVI
jgi:UDP-3-O-[3-hydroxymyristoyl] glucosamine N-acyltransferase